MDKLKMHSQDKVKEHIAQIAELFPNSLTETIKDGKVEQAIDFDILKQELSDIMVEGPAERYQFTWPDKKKSILLANAPIAKTLRPCREESVDFDMTENLYIEGDNLDALKLLQETYLGKVKMIYIDPPYNTGSDFVYEDDFVKSVEDFKPISGDYTEEGGRLTKNLETNGRFHTDWLNMMYPRLKLAKDLLSGDGVIFISIDDNEIENLKKLCNEIFGRENFVNMIAIKMSEPTGVKMAHVGVRLPKLKEYILFYKKASTEISPILIPKGQWDNEYKHLITGVNKDELTILKDIMYSEKTITDEIAIADQICKKMSVSPLDILFEEAGVKTDEEKEKVKYENAWRIVRDVATTGGAKIIADKKKKAIQAKFFIIVTPNDKKYLVKSDYNDNAPQPRIKLLFADNYLSMNPGDFWQDIKTTGLDNEGFVDFKNGKKPMKMIERLLKLSTRNEDLILDFFSGSATTAHAVMQLNAEDGGNRKFILIQLPEETDQKSEAYKVGFKNICDIGKERIRRVGENIKSEVGLLYQNLDTGFRVLKVDSTNMQDVYYAPGIYQQNLLNSLADNIKPDRTAEDLLFQVMLDLGVLLSSPIKEVVVGGKKVHNVADGYLLACFDSNVTNETVTEIAKQKPYYAIFRDSSMSGDSVATNFEQIFATHSPTTVRKVL